MQTKKISKVCRTTEDPKKVAEHIARSYKKEMSVTGIYLSGTGNTRHCLERLVRAIDENAKVIPIESSAAIEVVKSNETIYIGYPVQFSNAPRMVRDFILDYSDIWKGKSVFIIATMSLFSGDGTGCTARLLKKCGADILGGLHIKMPDSIGDSKLLKKPREEQVRIVQKADSRIDITAKQIKQGKYPKNGLSVAAHICGLLGQRLWFYKMTKEYSNKLVIRDNCNCCGKCVSTCPMNNIAINSNKVLTQGRCTMCYRCVNLCPKKAITLLGKHVVEPYNLDKLIGK